VSTFPTWPENAVWTHVVPSFDPEPEDGRTGAWCPRCDQPLVDLKIDGRGTCNEHGLVFADFYRPADREDADLQE
jgi:hypothetical protein